MKKNIFFFSASVLAAACGVFLLFQIARAQNAPSIPEIKSVVANSACQTEIQWAQNGMADKFVMSVNGGGEQLIPGVSCGGGMCDNLSYKHDRRTPNEWYAYRLKAVAGIGGGSAWSEVKSVKMPGIEVPVVPLNLRGDWDAAAKKLKVTWDPVPGLSNGGYRIYYSSNGVSYIPRDVLSQDMNFYEDFFEPSVPHYFQLKSYTSGVGCDTSDISLQSDGGIAKFSDFSTALVVPAAPSELKETVTQQNSEWRVVFLWKAAAGAEAYEFQISSDPSFSSPTVDIRDTQAISYTQVFSVTQSFYWRVRAVNKSNGNIAYSPYVSDAASVGFPPPSNLQAAYSLDRLNGAGINVRVTLTWRDNNSFMPRKAEIFETSVENVSTDARVYGTQARYSVNGTAFDPPAQSISFDLAPGKFYFYKVRITSPSGDIFTEFSPETAVDLTLTQITGEIFGKAWSAHSNSENNVWGIGWVSFNSKNPDGSLISQVPYRVAVDKENKIVGAAWASLGGGESGEYGWLAFGGEYTSGCPDGNCAAVLDPSTGKVSGWAKFINSSGGQGNNWDGFVKLRGRVDSNGNGYEQGDEPEYGLCLGIGYKLPEAGSAPAGGSCSEYAGPYGLMWGGSIAGWLMVYGEGGNTEPPGDIVLTPPGPISAAIFEKLNFKADRNVSWLVGAKNKESVLGGDEALGTVTPLNTTPNAVATYTASKNIGKVSVFASSSRKIVKADVNVTQPYGFVGCSSESTSTISIFWRTRFGSYYDSPYTSYATHKLGLYVGDSPATANQLLANLTPGQAGMFTHSGVESGKDYYYTLSAKYQNGFTAVISPVLGPCGAFIPKLVSDAPSRTKIFSNSPSVIYVNWKDNSTKIEPYHFVVERLKATPNESADFSAVKNSKGIDVSWTNDTKSTPYYHVLERKTENEDADFSKIIEIDGYNLPIPSSEDKEIFSFSDMDVIGGTAYYYRVKTCSTIDLSKAYVQASELKGGGVNKPAVACSGYAPSDSGERVVAVAAPRYLSGEVEPIAVSKIGSVIGEALIGGRKVDDIREARSVLRTVISSAKNVFMEAGKEIKDVIRVAGEKTKQLIIKNTNITQGKQIQPSRLDLYFKTSFRTDVREPVYKDTNLIPDTVYVYRVKTVYESSGVETEWDLIGAAKTLADNKGGTTEARPICMRNSYCDFSIMGVRSSSDISRSPAVEESESQCLTNSDCRDIGRAGQAYEEK